MEIKKLNFEKKEVQIKETYIDETGKTREKVKTIMMPTGNIISDNNSSTSLGRNSKKNS